MAKPDPERLAAALRENLRKRRQQGQASAAVPTYGSDEEGDVALPDDRSDKDGAWVREGPTKL